MPARSEDFDVYTLQKSSWGKSKRMAKKLIIDPTGKVIYER